MKVNMPLVTLLSGAALGVGVLIASTVSTPSTASASSTSATSPPAPAFTFTAPPPASSAPGTAPATAPATTPTTAPAAATTSAPAVTPTTAPPSAPATTPAAAASSSTNAPSQADYVAQVNGGGAAVAITVHKGKAIAYVCNGHAVAAWYRGTAAHGKLNLTGKDGARISVDYGSGHAAGSLTADGMHYTFSAPMVHGVPTGQRPPGLYEATATVHGVTIKAGWIVLPGGSQVGSVEYFANSAIPPTAQAPLLNLTTGTASYDGVTLVASLISGLTGSGF
jgi:hypothetical protein